MSGKTSLNMPLLAAMPPNVFLNVVGNLRMGQILALRHSKLDKNYKEIAKRIDSSEMWVILLERDFGKEVFSEFRRLRYLKQRGIKPIFKGDAERLEKCEISDEELYYKYLLKKFNDQVSDLERFIKNMESPILKNHTFKSRKNIENNLTYADLVFFEWLQMPIDEQRDCIAEYYAEYQRCIRRLISYYKNESLCFIVALNRGCPEIALSIAPLIEKNINFQNDSTNRTVLMTAMCFAQNEKNTKRFIVLSSVLNLKGHNLYLRDKYQNNALDYTVNSQISLPVHYYALKVSKPNCKNELFSSKYLLNVSRQGIYNYILSKVDETTDTELQEKIVQEAIAETILDEDGEHPSLLREYLGKKTGRFDDQFTSNYFIEQLEELAAKLRVVNEIKRAEETEKLKKICEAYAVDDSSISSAQKILTMQKRIEEFEDVFIETQLRNGILYRKTPQSAGPDLKKILIVDGGSDKPIDFKLFTRFNVAAAAVVVGACVGFVLNFGFHLAARTVVPGSLLSVVGVLVLALAAYQYMRTQQAHTKTPLLTGYPSSLMPAGPNPALATIPQQKKFTLYNS